MIELTCSPVHLYLSSTHTTAVYQDTFTQEGGGRGRRQREGLRGRRREGGNPVFSEQEVKSDPVRSECVRILCCSIKCFLETVPRTNELFCLLTPPPPSLSIDSAAL